ncbi:non-ribosomal peptide synthetase [Nonomuraea sp. NPDC049400]|uniref:non-ribosomal peptide synthetase n=1 Tax=Nonomuraea sp. NPDC049400 TaxID=3364352 RepID=UPI0037898BA0
MENPEHDASRVAVSTLTELFGAIARRHPDRIAVRDDVQALTYAQLDERSDAVAAALRRRGVVVEDRVGVHLRRSAGLIAAVLGVLKAGAAYVAVDTRYPNARRDLMLHAGSVHVVITEDALAKSLGDVVPEVLRLEQVEPAEVVDAPVMTPSNAASVLFTSGSSGAPKAIVLEHRNILSFATNPALPRLTDQDRVGQISSVSFDAFHFELWSAIAAGAQIVVLPAVPDLLSADFQRQMRRHRISAMLVPTMVVNHVVREDRDAFAPLRVLQAGGDVLLPSTCRDLLAGAFTGELYNLYGPAEITTACTAHLVTAQDATGDSIPIGRPLDGVTLRIVRPDLSPVAPGEVGELLVGGSGVARGYLGAPRETGERFITMPGAGRLYRTGDLVRQRDDGVLLFMGRADNQVKVRGYRVEPGEAERALRRHPEVSDAVVLPDGEGEDRRLVAFVVLDGTLPLRELRVHAEAELPDYLVPSDMVALPSIPATDHGKRDLDALRTLLAKQRARDDSFRQPQSDTAQYLAQLWQELLGIERVGLDDDFFALGGHSLQAFRAQRRINRDLGIELELKVLLRNTVLADLVSVMDELIDDALAGDAR